MANTLRKFGQWLVTEKGRNFTFGCVCVSTIGVLSAYTLPHTICLNKYREIIQLYKSGIPVKVPAIVQERFNTALSLLDLTENEQKRIKPFSVFGFDVFNAGTLYSKYGGIVGIPVNFSCDSVEEINRSDILVNGEPVNWSSDAGNKLLNSLIISDKAQIFAIAREVSTLSSIKLFLNTFYATSTVILMYGLGNYINTKYNLYARPFALRGSLYSIVTLFGYGIYVFLTDYTQIQFDMKIDRDLCAKNKVFIEGGKEFYDKTIERNIALRKLMGPYGEHLYSVLGNENFLIRQKRLPLVVRKDFFASKLGENL